MFARIKSRTTRSGLPLGLVLVLAAVSIAPAQEKGLSPQKRGQVEKAISDFLHVQSVPGISAAAVLNSKTVWSEGFGVADLENYAPATSSTLYRLGSISKPITAVAILQLSDRGKLDLDAPVQKYCPSFPRKDSPITTRQLLGHLGGIRHYNADGKGDIPKDSARHFATMEESLQLFAADPLVAKPETKFNYSTYGYTLIGCVLEGATSQKYIDYVRENIFGPAAMYQTQADDFFAVVQHRTRWYHKDKSGAVRNAGVLDSSYKIPGGGLISSADDMANFAAAILGGQLLSASSREAMWTVQHTSDGKATGYGLGWGVREKVGTRLIGHCGGQQGTSTSIVLLPERRSAVVVLANMDNVNVEALAEDLLKILLDLQGKTP